MKVAWIISLALLAACGSSEVVDEELDVGPEIAWNTARDGNYEVYIMGDDGLHVRNLTHDPATDWVIFSVHSQVVFASNRLGEYAPGTYDLFSVDVNGGQDRRMTSFAVYDSYAGHAEDPERYVVASPKDGDLELYVIDASGQELAKLTDNAFDDTDPDWSPSGSHIVFRSNRGGAWDLWVMAADGTSPVQITRFPDNDDVHGYQEGPPRWRPRGNDAAGEWIAFSSWRDGDFEIYLVRPDGTELHQLTDDDGSDGWPSWSDDGKSIAFDSDRDGNFEIYVMNMDGSDVRRLTFDPAPDQGPVWVR